MENKEHLNSNSELSSSSENLSNLDTQISSEEKVEDTSKMEKKESAADKLLKRLAEKKKSAQEDGKLTQEVFADIIKNQDISESTSEFAEEIHEVVEEIEELEEENVEEIERVDYSEFDREKLVEAFKGLLDKPVSKIQTNVENIKSTFYRKNKAIIDELRKTYLDEAKAKREQENSEEPIPEFKQEIDAVEQEFKDLYNQYKELKSIRLQEIEKQKEDNIAKKYKIIEEIENLINKNEDLSTSFEEFKNLQKQWKEIGVVPQSDVKLLWDKYNYTVERFYDYVKINKELRELDLKKNLEAKIALCERAEELILEQKVVKAFKELQKLHEQWREIGPTPNEKKEEVWERFKAATTQINKKHQEYFENIKQEQDSNLKAKVLICERAEEINSEAVNTHKSWEEKSKEIIELQKLWRLIGFAPKKDNNDIYNRFRLSCDNFFERKREFYSQGKEEQDNNLQIKTDMCVQAESLKDSTDWKKTTDLIINLQKNWKEVGPVPKKHSDEVWKRFRAACNEFFDRKEKFFSDRHKEEDENLKLKQDIITKISGLGNESSDEETLNKLKEFQSEWNKVGFVPIKQKDEVQQAYKAVLDEKFSQLRVNRRETGKFRNYPDSKSHKNNDRSFTDKEKLKNKIDTIQNKIVLWENNIGFFAKSKNADAMIADFNKQIEMSKEELKSLQKQLQSLDQEVKN